jgi:hypothetical protein
MHVIFYRSIAVETCGRSLRMHQGAAFSQELTPAMRGQAQQIAIKSSC